MLADAAGEPVVLRGGVSIVVEFWWNFTKNQLFLEILNPNDLFVRLNV